MSDHSHVIFAIDPSTAITGVALVAFDAQGIPTRLASASFDADEAYVAELDQQKHDRVLTRRPHYNSDTARFARIWLTRMWLVRWIARATDEHMVHLDYFAYEQPNMRGAGATAGIHQAIGAYCTNGKTFWLEAIKVNATLTKAPIKANGGWFRPAGVTADMLDEKQAMVLWACDTFGLKLDPWNLDAQAQADALGVAVAADKMLREAAAGVAKRRRPVRKKG